MKLAVQYCGCGAVRRRTERAFTLTEIMVASSIFVLVIAGVVSSHVFGLKMIEFSQAKLGANDASRIAIGLLSSEARSAKSLRIGTVTTNGFIEVAPCVLQKGRAIQLYPTNNTNVYIRYYLDASDGKLRRLASSDTTARVIAQSIKTAEIFTSEDFAGNVVSNRQNAFVLGLNLQFYQLNNPTVYIGPTNFYNSFSLQMKVCVRSAD